MDSLTGLKAYKIADYDYLSVENNGDILWADAVMDKLGNAAVYDEGNNTQLITKQGKVFNHLIYIELLGNGKFIDHNTNPKHIFECATGHVVYTTGWQRTSSYNQYVFNGENKILDTDDYSSITIANDIPGCSIGYCDGTRAIIRRPDGSSFATDRPGELDELIFADQYGNYTVLKRSQSDSFMSYRFVLYMGQPLEMPIIKIGNNDFLYVVNDILCTTCDFDDISIIKNEKCINYKIEKIELLTTEGFIKYTVFKIVSLGRSSKAAIIDESAATQTAD